MFNLLKKILLPLEFVALLATIIGIYLVKPELLNISMSVLAGVYFLNAFLPPQNMAPPGKQGDFFDLLATVIAFKLAWIACSVVVIGAMFMIMHLKGGDEQLFIGVIALAASVIIIGIYVIIKPNGSKLFPVLYRAVPVCLFGLYLMMNKPV